MAETDIEELNALFATPGKQLEPDLLAELQSIMRLHEIPPQELFYKWESYSIKMGGEDMKLDMTTARALKQDVQDGLERESRNKAHVRRADNKRSAQLPRAGAHTGDVYGMLDGLVPNTPRSNLNSRANGSNKRKLGNETPSLARLKLEPASSPPDFKSSPIRMDQQNSQGISAIPFNDRANAGTTLETLNDDLELPVAPIAPYGESRIGLKANSDKQKLSYRPMAMKLSEASEILDDRIDEFMVLVQAHHKLEDTSFGSAASQNINEVVAVGRIASDSSDGHLNPASLVLETSRRMGAGLRVHLDLKALSEYQFFPGQIVALRGINASGDLFVVKEVLNAPLLPSAASTPAGLEAHIQRLAGGPDVMDSDSAPAPLNILLGAGPYTADDNLDFEPLHELCGQAAESYADALILTGPFLDIDHPLIASGDFDLPDEAMIDPDTATLVTVFKYLISPIFQRLATENPTITIILIPSVRDAISKHVSWPQEAFPRKELGLPKAAKIVGNPMTLSINEMVVGMSSQDILYELKHEELTGGRPTEGGVLARLPKYMIEQRNFFPIFPPVNRHNLPKTGTEEGISAGAVLDLSYLKLGDMLNVRPDLLIVPSALPPFAKVVESVVVINPGLLSKRRAAGTYAKLTVYPATLSDVESTTGQMVGHKLFERARVDIIRI